MKTSSNIRELYEYSKEGIKQAIKQKRRGIKLTRDEKMNLMIAITAINTILAALLTTASAIITLY